MAVEIFHRRGEKKRWGNLITLIIYLLKEVGSVIYDTRLANKLR